MIGNGIFQVRDESEPLESNSPIVRRAALVEEHFVVDVGVP
jgi:hypothetical protein